MFAVTYIAHNSGVKLQLSLLMQFCNAYKYGNTSCEASKYRKCLVFVCLGRYGVQTLYYNHKDNLQILNTL